MKTLRARYAKTLATIENEPEFNRKCAEEHFLLIREFLSDFEKVEIARQGDRYSRRQAIIRFCKERGMNHAVFTQWLKCYTSKGIKGLLQHYGNRKGCSPYLKDILPIAAELIRPGQKISELYRNILPICAQLDVKPPSEKTLGRILKSSGLLSQTKNQKVITTVKLTLELDVLNPLNSLLQLIDFIKSEPVFSSAIKEQSTALLRKTIVASSRKSPLSLPRSLTRDEIKTLIRYRASQHKRHSAIATALLMIDKTALLSDVVNASGCHPGTVLAWIKKFQSIGIKFIDVKIQNLERTEHIAERDTRIIDIIHTPPVAYNINRTTWTYGAITKAYFSEYHEHISTKTVERAINRTGCTWRRIRAVQTSPDPEYRSKVERLLDTLQRLKEGERFFFIDEVGPYRVRKYGGKVLMSKDEAEILPEKQKNRGKVLFVAALEALTNQMIWAFTPDKSATAMIRLFEKIVHDYADCLSIFFTWDAISVHNSKTVTEWIAAHNREVERPFITVIPLPSNAQFLNVIESVFCGMKKAVICNSDYPTPHDMQEAIARHFEERNLFYRGNPKRAGNKIWDKQKFDFNKLAGGLFKKM